MKRILLLTVCIASLAACSTAQKTQPAVSATPTPPPVQPATPAPSNAFVSWDKKFLELGKVKKGEKREMFFELTNTSGAPIQIDIVDACVCTTTDFTRGVIPPGGKARVDATFDSTEKEESETIDINVLFKQNDEKGNPRLEIVKYHFDLEK